MRMAAVSSNKKPFYKIQLLKYFVDTIDVNFRALLYDLSPMLLVIYRFQKIRGKMPNLKNPQSFDEKLLWLMLNWRHPLKTQCADKYAMRSYVIEQELGHILPELLGVYDKSSEIDYATLPERFALKCTHGCGFNIICKSKTDLDWVEAKRKLDKWMKVDTSKLGGEIHYAMIKPRIICESYLDDSSNDAPTDYKVYCFDGQAHCTLVCAERGTSSTTFDIYDRDWKNKLPYSRSSLLANRRIPKPEAYEEMIGAAEKLAKPFPFVRVDFYNINGKPVIGEMTFTPNGCIDPGYTDTAQKELGQLIQLPEKLIK